MSRFNSAKTVIMSSRGGSVDNMRPPSLQTKRPAEGDVLVAVAFCPNLLPGLGAKMRARKFRARAAVLRRSAPGIVPSLFSFRFESP